MQPGQLKQALASAVDRKDAALAEALIRKGADVNAKFDNDFTLLHIVVQAADMDMACLLIRYGADIHKPNARGKTPLDIARQIDKNRELGDVDKNSADKNSADENSYVKKLTEAFSLRHTRRVKAQHQLRGPAIR